MGAMGSPRLFDAWPAIIMVPFMISLLFLFEHHHLSQRHSDLGHWALARADCYYFSAEPPSTIKQQRMGSINAEQFTPTCNDARLMSPQSITGYHRSVRYY